MQFGRHQVDLSRPKVMGILNITPDSFSDGGAFFSLNAALQHASEMVAAGAHFIDVGGESTRPGAQSVSVQQELDRVVPVVEALVARFDVPVSVDTSTPEVMRAAAEAGAGLINDVRALRRLGALVAAAETGLPVCLMHMRGEPGTMQQQPGYDDVCTEVLAFLCERIESCRSTGIGVAKLLLDPGIGFGKTLAHNVRLMQELPRFVALGLPVLVGVSRKSMVGALTGRDVAHRLAGSLSAGLFAVSRGARIIRVHDVAETVDALRVWEALEGVVHG